MTSRYFFAARASSRCNVPQALDDDFHFIAQIQPHVEGHLIVAAARRVQFAAGRTDHLGQAPLDVHVNVFIGRRKSELAVVDLALNSLQAADDLAPIARGMMRCLASILACAMLPMMSWR